MQTHLVCGAHYHGKIQFCQFGSYFCTFYDFTILVAHSTNNCANNKMLLFFETQGATAQYLLD